MEDKITFFIIKDLKAMPKRIDLSKKIIIGSLASLGILLIFFSFIIYNYFSLKGRVEEVSRLKEDNRQQRLHLTSLTKDIESLNTRLSKLQTSNTKLQILAGIKKAENNKQIFGVGGGTADDMLDFSYTNLNRLIEQMYEEIESLEFEIVNQENNVLEMITLIEERKSVLDSTPAIWPTKGWVTSTFGYRKSPFTGKRVMHNGLDIATRRGTPIISTARGVVIFSGIKGNYGNVVAISHGYGFTTVYGHNSLNLVKVGDKVERSDVIAYLGNTGRSTAPHLHYEVRLNGKSMDPVYYILD